MVNLTHRTQTNIDATLIPFTGSTPIVLVQLHRDQNQLDVRFALNANHSYVWPDPKQNTQRLDELWLSTCFECFIGIEGQELYLEVNLAPSGDWQVYEFTNYRQDQSEAPSVAINMKQSLSQALIQFTIDIDDERFVTEDWKISPCCVLACANGERYYMATSHPAEKPDFHLSDIRSLTLPVNPL